MRVLFVCLGNICRSPLAEGIFRHHVEQAGLADQIEVDSAGTGGWHVGELPDPRSIEVAARHGIDLTVQRARQFTPEDLRRFDHVMVMDRSNLNTVRRHTRSGDTARVALMMEEAPERPEIEVPDPYYGAGDGFQRVYEMIDAASAALLERVRGEL